jgi:hypothetical protein
LSSIGGSNKLFLAAFRGRTSRVKIRFLILLKICIVLAGVFLWLSQESRANAAEFFGTGANDVTMVEYDGLTPAAQVHVARMFIDYERHGFFRIGLLPIPVVENVQIQIQSAGCLTNAMFALHSWNQPSVGAERLELRNLEIRLLGEKQPRLSAASARVGKDGVLELSAVSVFNTTGQQTSIPKAVLQAAGSSAGWLHWNANGHPQELFLFKPTSDKTP